ncbi:ABC transporter substrate-binding protein [Falsiroseomonas tokyonensis]|uniref:ABC transporter substrate-binding protein n=1 Tax=Falsiroseomonas tokyonensis TaxID=430521 RepID=A0ABV7C2M1_9PROT|nr:ABC transporter substrate-binding protein [Falsiroseomonas tokyonensis]MBU8540703.1 ABC transporter substrate-binding protein [Falsiroseomonas tokyonensis]
MSISRRATLALLPAMLAAPALAQGRGDPDTLRVKLFGDLRGLDPFISPEYMARNHGYMVYDTLFALDSRLRPQPQMVESHSVSADRLTWDFALRPGLRFHDGAPVTSEDVVASLRRWAIRDGHGAQMLAEGNTLTALDARRFRLVLQRPWGLVLDALAKPSGLPAFIMPARVAATPITTPITDPTGSGPYMLRREDWRIGDRTTYRRNPDYQPRAEAPDGLAGGKHARIERVEWVALPDATTALSALQTGEIDIFEECPPDLFPVVARNRNLRLAAQDAAGVQPIFRMNHAVPPFDNLKLRQAMRLLVDPAEMMPAYMTERDRWQDCRSFFPCASPFHTSEGWMAPNLDLARTAVQQSGYDGTPVVVLDAQDSTISSTFARVAADRLRRVGMTVDLQAMDWATLVTRRLSKNPVGQGGWSLFVSAPAAVDLMDPVSHIALRAAGARTALPGWPDDPELERLRDEFAFAATQEDRQRIARQVQQRAVETVPYLPIGMMSLVRGHSARLQGILNAAIPVYWNISKTA